MYIKIEDFLSLLRDRLANLELQTNYQHHSHLYRQTTAQICKCSSLGRISWKVGVPGVMGAGTFWD